MDGRNAFAVLVALVVGATVLAQKPPTEDVTAGSARTVLSARAASGDSPLSGAACPLIAGQERKCSDEPCGPLGRFWVEKDAVLWWVKGASLPPLVTASPAGTPLATAGVLGAPGTMVLLGEERVNDKAHFGGLVTAGYWLDDEQALGVEASFFLVDRGAQNFQTGSSGTPILARPFFDVTTGMPSSELIAFPGVLAGTVAASATSSDLIGAGALIRCNLCSDCNNRLDAVAGYRFLRFRDRLGITEDLVRTDPTGAVVPVGTALLVNDHFEAENEFHGLDFGLAGEVRRGPFVLTGLAKLAVGNNEESVRIAGSTTVTVPGTVPVTSAGGLLALGSNSGTYERDRCALVPELGIKLGYLVRPHTRFYAGYTLLYWADIVRASDQIDLGIIPSLLPPVRPSPGPLRPSFNLHETSFWAQGIELGLEMRF